MSYATPRSCRQALHEGMTDGAVWKPETAERGGIVSSPSNQTQAAPMSPREPMRGLMGRKGEC